MTSAVRCAWLSARRVAVVAAAAAAVAVAVAAIAAIAAAQDPSTAGAAPFPGIEVRAGRDAVLLLRTGASGRSAAERAAAANDVVRQTMGDPDCDASGFALREQADGSFLVEICGRNALEVTAADALLEAVDLRDLATRWEADLRDAWTREKAREYSQRLVEAAILGLLYPLGFLIVAGLVHLLFRRGKGWLAALASRGGVRVGPLRLMTEQGERGLLLRLVGAVEWTVYLLLAYVFLIAVFDRFPRTIGWARRMLALLEQIGAASAKALLGLAPRLFALALLVLAVQILMRAIGRVFEQVRTRRLRIDPIVTPDNARAAEITARALVLLVALFLASLLVPGDVGIALLGVFGMLGLAVAIGARPVIENLLAGVVIAYGRPFRTGQAVRLMGREGVVERKGLLQLTLHTRDDGRVLVPNRSVMMGDLAIVDGTRALRLEVVLETLREESVPDGLFRHAAAEAGLKREDGTVELHEVREGARIYRAVWQLPPAAKYRPARDAFLRSLVARDAALGFRVVAARTTPPESP